VIAKRATLKMIHHNKRGEGSGLFPQYLYSHKINKFCTATMPSSQTLGEVRNLGIEDTNITS
ncbi:MAG: hypothetical protein LBC71_03305, partial [Oscillospiraceae bacterium]|nr:hypothetical protein [Oscillospiraceae bacterium]